MKIENLSADRQDLKLKITAIAFFKKYQAVCIVALLLFIAAFLRFYNLDWDSGHFFHPDERNIANAVIKIHFFDQLNPEFFAYGGFSIYVYRLTANIISNITHNLAWVRDWGYINVVGRFIEATFSTLTILPLYFLSKKLFNKATALLSVTLYAFSVFSIQMAHFSVTESFLIGMSVAVSYYSLMLFDKPTLLSYLRVGILVGIATSSKLTALSFIIYPLVAFCLLLIKHKAKNILKQTKYLFVLLIGGFLTFTIFSPYTFLSWGKFTESMTYESGVATGKLQVPYTLQFSHTIPYLFQFINFFYQLGPIAVVIIPSLIWFCFLIIKKQNAKYIIFLSFPLIYFSYVGSWHTKFIRYITPVLPSAIILISFYLTSIHSSLRSVKIILITTSLAVTIFWALSFFTIYFRPQTRITASLWIYNNIKPGSKILNEHWDDGLPVPIEAYSPNLYTIEALTIYEPDNYDKILYYSEKLSSADYIIINSRRLYGTLIHLQDKYPVTSRYYKLLFSEKLGYVTVSQFTSYPRLFGIFINDDYSEETFQVYEHPKVIVFKNNSYLSKEQLIKLLTYD